MADKAIGLPSPKAATKLPPIGGSTPTGCSSEELRGELASFRQHMLADMRKMFEQHEVTVRQLLEAPSKSNSAAAPPPERRPSADYDEAFAAPAPPSAPLPSASAPPPLPPATQPGGYDEAVVFGDDEDLGLQSTDTGGDAMTEKKTETSKDSDELCSPPNMTVDVSEGTNDTKVWAEKSSMVALHGSEAKDHKREFPSIKEDEEVCVKHLKINGVFGDLGTCAEMDLVEPIYDVMNFYKDKGLAQWVARHHIFADTTLAVISLNAVYIGVELDNNTESYILDYDWPYLFMDNAFCVFFVGELVFRFGAFQRKMDCFKDGWFKFDSTLVALMVAETWVMPAIFSIIGGRVSLPTGPLRLLRLLRLSRLVRLIRTLPELVTMFKGMFVASRAVGSSLLMVSLLIYVFGIVVHMGLGDEESQQEKFGTLPKSMWTLLMDGTFMDSTGDVLTTLMDMGKFNTVASAIVFLTFILLSAMTVMNMLIGVLCEVVSTVAQGERDEAAIRLMKESILVELNKFDEDGNGKISKAELEHVMKDRKAIAALSSMEVGPDCINELQQMLFYGKSDDTEVTIEQVMELVLMYRGDLTVTVKHLVEMIAFSRWYLTHQITEHTEHTEKHLIGVLDTYFGNGGISPKTAEQRFQSQASLIVIPEPPQAPRLPSQVSLY